MRTVGIIGYGRFGRVLDRLLGADFNVLISTRSRPSDRQTVPIKKLFQRCQTVFYCVPIGIFESVVKQHRQFYTDRHLLIDVLSVKEHPQRVWRKYLKGLKTQAILTHPMFGPDSSKAGFTNLPIAMDQFKTSAREYFFWKRYFQKKGLKIIELTPKQHDKLAASSQGLTHFVGRLLEELGYRSTKIDTYGAKKLLEIMEQTCNDSWELFLDLQNQNLFTKSMRLRLGRAYDTVFNKLLPRRVRTDKLVFGIQGGRGSFNEQALIDYTKRHSIRSYQVKYLYTTAKVLAALHRGEIDFGQFAIHNSQGGIVQESIRAMSRYKFAIVEEFAILIRHFLMKRKDVDFSDVKIIMSHDQVFKQCRRTLEARFPTYRLLTGRNDLIDHAKVAWALSKGKIDKNIAVIGPKILSELFDLEIVAGNLQDISENLTSFLMVKH